MKLTSPNFENNSAVPSKFTCDGEDVHPEFKIEDVPAEAKSLAIICDDPDSPAGTWTHWLIWNIPSETSIIKEGEIPKGAVEGKNTSGSIGYFGPCPGSGDHRYYFYLYALNSFLDVDQNFTKTELEAEISKYLISKTELMGTYQKKK